ncbi:caspase family protein [Okeania sp. KiyG1]|uniref:caspase family protein n=1 Tax=Okeania sp. KiyG1 TaxID=2720165 RepID=UPI001921D78F|nr:caspase family protein [Okeania sp. KiyG1]GGA50945.1 hypothetical protein CYANOKiyG1_70580 [Okeania sp. KiyG1]
MANKFAMTIGVQEYQFVLPLKCAANDAEKMRNFLLKKAGFDEVWHYSDDSSNSDEYPGRSNIEIKLEQIGNLSMGSDDRFWFFFSGHGSIYDGIDYLMLSDTHKDIQKSAISVNYVIQQLKKCGAGNVVLFLDMCRDQGIKSIKGPGEQTKQKARQMGMISFFSCSSNEYSWELQELQHGAFTYALLKLLGTEKGETVKKLNKSLKKTVKQLTQDKGRQTPCVVADPIEMYHSILIPKYATINNYQNEIEEDFLTPIDEKIASPKLPKDSICVEPNIDLENLKEFPSEPQTDNLNGQTTDNQEEVMTLQELLQKREIIEHIGNQSNEKQEEIVTQTQSVLSTLNIQEKSNKFSWTKILVSAASLVMLAFGTNLITLNPLSEAKNKLPKAPYPGMNDDYKRIRLVDERVNNIQEENLAIIQFNQNDIPAGKWAVERLLETGKLEKAREAIAAVPEQLKDYPEINFLKGRLAWEIFQDSNQNNLIDEAISYWEKAAAKSQKNIQYHNALGFAYYTKGDIEKAYSSWLKVLHLSGEITPEMEKARPVPDSDQGNLSINKREALNAYAGLGLIKFKSAQNLQKTPRQALSYVNKVMGESGKDFHIQQLQKNWLWSPRARQDWDFILNLNIQKQAFEQNKYSEKVAVISCPVEYL